MAISSPPYWGLRSYEGQQKSIWDGTSGCNHQWGPEGRIKQSPQRDHAKGGGFASTRGNESSRRGMAFEAPNGSFCTLCNAWKGAYGLEPSTTLYVEHTIEILTEIRRVL